LSCIVDDVGYGKFNHSRKYHACYHGYIPHNDGIVACRKIWEQRTDQDPPTECLVEMLTLVLKNNNFTFDGNHYLQINGTAMVIDEWILLACSKNSSSSLSLCIHFMSTSSINRNHERGFLSDERSNRSSRSPIKMLFDGNHYLQINGTALGTKMAPSYANIFMGDLEERLLLSSLKKPLSWFRFIDDVDMNV
jgi:hypothetical protein